MKNLPVTFFAQLFARFGEKNPKFYSIIIKNSLYFTAAAVAFPFIVTDALPGLGVDVPIWLTYANTKFVAACTFLAGLGVGGAVVGSTTVQTSETPPLITDTTGTSNAELAAQIAEIRSVIVALQTKLEQN